MTLDDSQLMQRVQQGDLACFDVLVARYRPALIRVAAGALGDATLAEDVVQETFLAVFSARHTFNPAFRFRTWLWTILLNLCRRQRARLGRQPQVVSRSVLQAGPGSTIGEPATLETGLAALLKREETTRLHLLLNELPDVQADAIRLRFFGGLTYEEIAQTTGVSLGGAKLRVRSGLTALSRRLVEHPERSEETNDEL